MTSLPKSKVTVQLENKFVAYIDVMGFNDIVNSRDTEKLNSYFSKITDVLESIRVVKNKIQSFLISDSIILIAPDGLNSLRQLINAIRQIQSGLLWRKILLRGSIAYGEIYYDDRQNIVVGKGFIKAYRLEQQAVYPRVIIDPAIIIKVANDKAGFIRQLNKTLNYNFENQLIYIKSKFCQIKDDGIFIDYANKSIKQNEINGNLIHVYEMIIIYLYSNQELYNKYVWLRDYFLECLKRTLDQIGNEPSNEKYRMELKAWIEKFERL